MSANLRFSGDTDNFLHSFLLIIHENGLQSPSVRSKQSVAKLLEQRGFIRKRNSGEYA